MNPIKDKNFLNFLGKPLIQHQIERLADVGFDDFVIVGGAYNFNALKSLATNLPYTVSVVEQKDLTNGMAGAVLAARDIVDKDSAIVVSGNDIVDKSCFESAFDLSKNTNLDGFLVAKEVTNYFPGGYLNVKNGLVHGIVEKPGAGNEPSNLVNIVIHFFSNFSAFTNIVAAADSHKDDRYEVALDTFINSNNKIGVLPYDGFWQPVKYPWHIMALMEYFLNNVERKTDGADISSTAVIRGNVYLEDGVKIFDHATVVGPAYIGKNCVVANNALVRNSIVGESSVIGYATEIARSFLGKHVWTHSNYVGDSILGNNVSFGAGTVTGNLRFDEKDISVKVGDEIMNCGRNKFGLITGDNVRSGVNTSFMPGIKIGSNVCVGAGLVIANDIDDNKFVSGSTDLRVYDNRLDIANVNRGELNNKFK